MSTRPRGRRRPEEEHENHERWMVTYADMVTLLMVLFIVLFAMSTVDAKKYMALKSGLAAGFANSASVLPGSETLLEEIGTNAVPPVSPKEAVTQSLSQAAQSQTVSEKAAEAERRAKAVEEVRRLRAIEARIKKRLAAQGLADDVRTKIDERGLVISLVSQHVVFRADLAELSPRGKRVVDALGPVLRDLPENLQISGHTNQVAVKPAYYASDWDLSAARAVTVLRRLNEQLGVPAARLSAAAYGNTRPLEDPSLPGSQQINKRVDIVILSTSDEDTRQLYDQLADSDLTASTVSPPAAGPSADSGTGGSVAGGSTSQEGTRS